MIALMVTAAIAQAASGTDAGPVQKKIAVLGDHGQFHIENFTTFSGGIEGARYAGKGNPMVVEDTDLGLRMEATSMDCTLANNSEGKLILTKAVMDGNAQIWIDTSQADQARAAEAARQNLPAPPTARQTSKMHLASDHIEYEAGDGGAVATCSQSVDYTNNTLGSAAKTEAGQPFPVRYDQTLHVAGSGGDIELTAPIVSKESDAKPKSMHIDGPVRFDLTRNETSTAPPLALPKPKPASPPKTKPRKGRPNPPPLPPLPIAPTLTTTVTVVHGIGDRFDADFVSAADPRLTLDGHVAVDGTGPTIAGTTYANEAVVTLDRATEEPKKYDFTGRPAVTSLKSMAPITPGASGVLGGGGRKP